MHRTLLSFVACIIICNTYGIAGDLNTPAMKALTVQGIVEPFRYAVISPEIPGRISAIDIPEGKTALKGDTILRIEYTEDKLYADRARLLAENNADVNAAKLKVETTKLDYEATKLVFDSTSAVSEEEVWEKKYEYELACSELDQLLVSKKKEAVEYRIALARLRMHFVIAPYKCVVAQVMLKEWESCKVGEPFVKIVDVQKCRFVTYVPSSRSHGLVKGKKTTIQLNGGKSLQTKVGIVDFISPVVDASSGLRTVKIVFDNADGVIQPGVTGSMQVVD